MCTKTKMAVAATSLLLLVGCGETANAPNTVSATLKMTSSSQNATVAKNSWSDKLYNLLFPTAVAFVPPVIVDTNGTNIALTDAWVMIKEVEFEAEETPSLAETDGDEIEFVGPYAVNLLSSAPVALDTQSIVQQSYRRIKMKLHKAEAAVTGAPAQLVNNSVYFAGAVGANAFTFESDDTTEFEIGGPNPVLPADGSAVLVQIQLANVFKLIDMSVLPNGAAISASNRYAGVNLCPSIDPSANDIYTCVRNGLRAQSDWGCDLDDDDDLDASDDSAK